MVSWRSRPSSSATSAYHCSAAGGGAGVTAALLPPVQLALPSQALVALLLSPLKCSSPPAAAHHHPPAPPHHHGTAPAGTAAQPPHSAPPARGAVGEHRDTAAPRPSKLSGAPCHRPVGWAARQAPPGSLRSLKSGRPRLQAGAAGGWGGGGGATRHSSPPLSPPTRQARRAKRRPAGPLAQRASALAHPHPPYSTSLPRYTSAPLAWCEEWPCTTSTPAAGGGRRRAQGAADMLSAVGDGRALHTSLMQQRAADHSHPCQLGHEQSAAAPLAHQSPSWTPCGLRPRMQHVRGGRGTK